MSIMLSETLLFISLSTVSKAYWNSGCGIHPWWWKRFYFSCLYVWRTW